MASTEERMKILKMIQEGKITAEEGAKLLAALRESRGKTGIVTARAGMTSRGESRGWLRVRVTDMATGKTKVNVNLPAGLIDAGMRIGAQYAPELQGMDLGELLNEIKSGASGKIIDVVDEEDGEHVEIFIE